ncbi:DMT family transporter [Paenibacillus sp. GYB003]|uniref:DMT family transporter n=1 Tax=Paenibacillus sp. GYB003 TaxID=2994392 RepID=UPI002F96B481
MDLPVVSLALVMCSGLAHAVWNLFAKKSENKAVFLWAMYIPSTIALLPVLAIEAANVPPKPEAWLSIALSLALNSVYALLLAMTYKRSDLSQAYPVMRGTPTLLVPVLGVAFLHESLPPGGWVGIGCLVAGFAVMSGWLPGRGGTGASLSAGPFLLALSVGLCSTAYTFVDKLNLAYLSPIALLVVTNLGFILGLTPSALASGSIRAVIGRRWKSFLVGALLSPGSYLLFLFAMSRAPMAYIAPLREIGIVFGVLLGLLVLKEKHGASRLAASAAVVAGIFMIAVSGN